MLLCAFGPLTFLCFTSFSWMHHLWPRMLIVPEREFKIHFWDKFSDHSAFFSARKKKNCKHLARRKGVLIILLSWALLNPLFLSFMLRSRDNASYQASDRSLLYSFRELIIYSLVKYICLHLLCNCTRSYTVLGQSMKPPYLHPGVST